MLFALLGCGCRAPAATHAFRRLTRADFCLTLTVYARADAGSEIGFLQGEALVPDRGQLVPAVNVEMKIDGRDRSVWRRQAEALQWYVRVDDPMLKGCRWIENHRRYEPGHLEFGLDQRLWLREHGQWSIRKGIFSKRISM